MRWRRVRAILRRQVRRPSFGSLLVASLALHLALFLLLDELYRGGLEPRPPLAPLIVELPPAEPGRPLSPPVPPQVARPPAARPAPSRPEPPSPPPAPPAPARPVPPPPRVAAIPPPPPRPAPPAPEVKPPESSPVPEAPAPALPAPKAPEPPAPALKPPEPSPQVARALPEPSPQPPQAARPIPPAPSGEGGEEPGFLGERRLSLLPPRLELPRLPGEGGVKEEGQGAGESGTQLRGQVAIPLSTPDPRYQDYFQELKRRIEEHLVYPSEAARKGQSGQLLLAFVIKRDGSLRMVELQHSSGFPILDRYSLTTVQLAAPFPPFPRRIPDDSLLITASFTYVLTTDFRSLWLR